MKRHVAAVCLSTCPSFGAQWVVTLARGRIATAVVVMCFVHPCTLWALAHVCVSLAVTLEGRVCSGCVCLQTCRLFEHVEASPNALRRAPRAAVQTEVIFV